MQYIILKAWSWESDHADRELEEQVKKHIAQGWRPLGGVSIAATPAHQDSRGRWYSNGIHMAQAMTKE